MGSLAGDQRAIDAAIFDAIGERMLVGSVEIPGVFYNRPREVDAGEGRFIGVEISFDCQISSTVSALERDELVQVIARDNDGIERDLGTYQFHRRVPDKGDESGLVIVDLRLAP